MLYVVWWCSYGHHNDLVIVVIFFSLIKRVIILVLCEAMYVCGRYYVVVAMQDNVVPKVFESMSRSGVATLK